MSALSDLLSMSFKLTRVDRTGATADAMNTAAAVEATVIATMTAAAAMDDATIMVHHAIVMVVETDMVETDAEAAATEAIVHLAHLQQMALVAMAQSQVLHATRHHHAATKIVVVTTRRNEEVRSSACVGTNKTGVTEQATVFFQHHESLGKLHPRSFCWSRLIHVLLQLPFSRCDFSMCY